MRLTVRVALLLLLATSAHAARKPKLPPLEPLIERAKAAVVSGRYDVQRDLAPLLQRLAVATDEEEQDDLIDLIEELGEEDAIMPAAVKLYLRESAPPVLMQVARTSPFKTNRANAILVLRDLNVDEPVIDEAVAIAQADAERSVRFHGTLLANWRSSRPRNYVPTPTANEQAALEYLRRRRERISAHALGGAAREGEKFFCAGANIGMLQKVTPQFKYYFCLHANETLLRLEHTPKLVIAALNGHCVGGGLEIAMAADIRIAILDARGRSSTATGASSRSRSSTRGRSVPGAATAPVPPTCG